MNTIQLQAGAGAINRRIGFNQDTARQVQKHYGIPLLCAFLVALGGCSAQAPAEAAKSKDISGLYTLVAVNGNKVPASISHEGVALQVRSGTFTIKADGTCGTKTTFVPPSGSEVAREVSATYTRDGSKLTMQWQGAGTTTGTIEGNSFTMDNEGMVFTYQK